MACMETHYAFSSIGPGIRRLLVTDDDGGGGNNANPSELKKEIRKEIQVAVK